MSLEESKTELISSNNNNNNNNNNNAEINTIISKVKEAVDLIITNERKRGNLKLAAEWEKNFNIQLYLSTSINYKFTITGLINIRPKVLTTKISNILKRKCTVSSDGKVSHELIVDIKPIQQLSKGQKISLGFFLFFITSAVVVLGILYKQNPDFFHSFFYS